MTERKQNELLIKHKCTKVLLQKSLSIGVKKFINLFENSFSTLSVSSLSPPKIILAWVNISNLAVLSVKNSGEKIIFKCGYFFCNSFVVPGKTVDLIMYIGPSIDSSKTLSMKDHIHQTQDHRLVCLSQGTLLNQTIYLVLVAYYSEIKSSQSVSVNLKIQMIY